MNFQAGQNCRTPVQILGHIGDLFDWALSMAKGQPAWHDSVPLSWPDEVQRFFESLKRFDDYLAGPEQLHASPEKLCKDRSPTLEPCWPIAILRRISGVPIQAKITFTADIAAGRVGKDQPAPKIRI